MYRLGEYSTGKIARAETEVAGSVESNEIDDQD
jgi:hypothetical protein